MKLLDDLSDVLNENFLFGLVEKFEKEEDSIDLYIQIIFKNLKEKNYVDAKTLIDDLYYLSWRKLHTGNKNEFIINNISNRILERCKRILERIIFFFNFTFYFFEFKDEKK